MSSSFEKSVKGATKIKAAPPKTKYIEHILIATHSGEHGVAEVFRALQNRLQDSTWTVVFKSLITVHLMIREGAPNVTLAYLSKHRNQLAISNFSDVQTQGRNIRHYLDYLVERARGYKDTHCDFVRGAEKRLESLPVDKGLLRETEAVQHQITALLKCDVLDNEPENEVTITVFRMLVLDLLAMFHVMNQAMINILGHFFEMSKSDAERALEIYKNFTKQTDFVVSYLSTARQYEHHTRVEVPKLKHAPTNLVKQLEDYLLDPDFEINRRQYLAEQDAKKGGRGTANGAPVSFGSSSKTDAESRVAAGRAFPSVPSQAPTSKPAVKGPDPDLIDFFDSIEQNQQPMATEPNQQQQMNMSNFTGTPQYQMPQQQFQQNGFGAQAPGFQNSNQFQQLSNTGFMLQDQPQGFQPQQSQPLQTNFTGAGFGGYTPQQSFQSSLTSIPDGNAAIFQNQRTQPFGDMNPAQQTTNPFRHSMVGANPTAVSPQSFPASPPTTSPLQQSTNPFAKNLQTTTFSVPSEQNLQHQGLPAAPPLQSMQTGSTNPFARNISTPIALQQQQQQPQTAGTLMPQATGSTNPFRQSQFVNTATGLGWQTNQQPIGGGLDHLETVPVFPRPAQQQPWQQ